MPNIYGKKSWSEMQKEDKKRRQTNPTPQEAARASKVQYTGEISGNSAKKGAKSYQWEQDLLGDYKGRSYNDKYAKFAKQQGFSFTDSVEFRKFMDVQENSKKPVKTNKDGSVRANQSFQPGQGMQTLDSLYNSIISDSNKKFNANMASRQKEQQKQADLQQAKKHDVVKATNTERDGVLGFLDRHLGRASDAMINDVMSLFDKNFVKKQNANYAQIAADKLKSDNADVRKKGIEQAQMLNAQTRPAKNASEKAADFIGTGLGEAAPYMFGAYGVADKALKGVKGFQTAKPLVQDLVRGGVAGLGVGSAKAGIQNLTDKNYTAKDAIDRILMESLTAGGGDAVLGAVGRNLNLKGQLDSLLKDTKSTPYSDQLLKDMVDAGNKQIGNPVNVLADAKTITPGLTDAERQAIKQGIHSSLDTTNTIDNVLQQVTEPKPLTKADLEGKIGFAQMNDNVTVRKPEPVQARQNQAYWQNRYEDFVKHVNENYDTNKMTPEALDEAWTHFAKYDEPVKLNDVVDLAYPKGYEPPPTPVPEVPKEPTLKDMLSGDEKINELIRQLTPPKRPEVPQAPPIDIKGKRSLNILPEQPKRLSDLDAILNSLKGTSEPSPIPKASEPVIPPTVEPMPKVDKSQPLFSHSGAVSGVTSNPISKGIDYAQSVEKSQVKANKESWISKTVNKVSKTMVDDGAYIKSAENELKGKKRFGEEGVAYKLFSMAKGAASQAEYKLDKELLPVFEGVNKEGGKLTEAFDYMYAKHLLEVKANRPQYVLPSGVTEEDLVQTVAKYADNPVYNGFVDKMNQFNKSIVDELVSSSRYSQETADELATMYPNYLPKFKLKDVNSTDKFDQAFFNDYDTLSSGNPMKRLKDGSDEMIQDPVKSMNMYVQKAMQSAANNRALQQLDDLATLDTTGKWVSYDKTKGGTPIDFFVDGKPRTVYVEKELAEAYKRGTAFEMDAMTGFLKGMAKMQRLSITGSPAFMIRNLVRDTSQGWANSRAGLGVRDIVGSTLDLMTDGKYGEKVGMNYLDDFHKSGAGMSNVWSQDSKQFRTFQDKAYKEFQSGYIDVKPTELKTAKFAGKILDWYRKNLLNKSENLIKYAEYRATMRKGGTELDAAYNARDMLDFFRAGTFGRKVNPYVSFYNVTVQGRAKFGRSVLEKVADGDMKGLTRVVGKNALLATAPSALAWWAYDNMATDGQKKIIAEAPDYLRNTFWLVPAENGKDIYRIPKPFETAAISTPFEYYLRKMDDVPQDGKKETQEWIVRNLLFDPSLNIATPVYELLTNKDTSFGMDIVPAREKGLKPTQQKDIYTSRTAEGVSKVADTLGLGNTRLASPRHIDNLINGYFPIAGQKSMQAVDKVLASVGLADKKNLPANDAKGFLRDFISGEQFRIRGYGTNSPLLGDLFDTRDHLMGIRKQNGGKFPDLQLASDWKELSGVYKDVSDLSGEIRSVTNDKNLSSEEKQTQLNSLIKQRNELVRSLQTSGVYERAKQAWK